MGAEGVFTQNYKLTIGVDFAMKSVTYDDDTKINLQLWDIAGHERFGYMTRVYYKYAMGAVIVFDLSRPATLESVKKWHMDIKDKVWLSNGQPIPMVLLANKSDIPGLPIQPQLISDYAQEQDFTGWFLTFAKEDININSAMDFLVEKILAVENESPKAVRGCFQITDESEKKKKE